MDRRLALLVKFAGIDQLTGKMRSIGGASKQTAQDIGQTRREIDRLRQAQARIGAFKDYEGKLRSTNAALEAQAEKLRDLRAAQNLQGDSSRKLQRQIATAEREERKLIELREQHGTTLQRLSTRLTEAGIDVEQLARHEDRLGMKLYEANKRLKEQRAELDRLNAREVRIQQVQQLGSDLQSGGATAAVAGAAAGTPFVISAKNAMDFEEAMADVRKVVDFKDNGEFNKMGRDILQLSRTLPIAATGIAQIVAAGGQADIPRKELLLFARDAGTMSVAFDISADAAGDMMAKWRAAFNMGREGAIDLANKINYLGNTTAAGTDVISDIVTRVGALGDVAGLNSGQIAALGATLGSMGIESEVAATGIKNTMLALTKGEAATKGQKAAFEALGLSATDVAKRMQKDAAGTILDVMGRIGKLSKDRQAGQLTELFGSESVAAIAPMLTQLETMRANLMLVGDAHQFVGSMQAEFDTRSQTTAAALQLFQNRTMALQIVLGEKLLPHIIRLAEWAGNLADRFSAWADRNPGITSGLVTMGAAIAGLAVIFGTIASAIGTVMIPLARFLPFLTSAVGWILRFAGVAVASLAAFLGIPAWIVGAIVIGLGVAVAFIYTHWEKVKAIFGEGATALSNMSGTFFKVGINLMTGLYNGIASRVDAIRTKIISVGSDIAKWFRGVLGIHSPSRVFMGLGAYLTQGLALGIDDGAAQPIDRMKRLSGQLTSALATGAALSASAMPAGAVGGGGAGAGASVTHYHHYEIRIDGAGLTERQLMDALERKLAEIEAKRAAAERSAYRDRND